jgi:hypothetical protein
MSGWNAWARCPSEAARAEICPWISETLREARGIGECDPARKLYPPPKVVRRRYREPQLVEGQLAVQIALAGGNATQPPIFGSGGASGSMGAALLEAQASAAVEFAASVFGADECRKHHESSENRDDCERPPAGSMRPRVTDDEIARVLTFVECGYSLRQASAAVGRNHASVLRCIRRNATLASEYRRRRELARHEPLLQLRQASQKSWRAAAWLLNYPDARERRPGKQCLNPKSL